MSEFFLQTKPGDPTHIIVSYSGSSLHDLSKYIVNILKTDVKDENGNFKNYVTFSNYIRNIPIEDEEIMVSFALTYLYMNVHIIK